MLVLFMAIGCAAYHVHTNDADLAVSATPYGSRQIVDAETGHEAVAKATANMPVTYSTSTRTPFGETSTTVSVGGYVPRTYGGSGYDLRPDASAGYRARYAAAQGSRTTYVPAPGAKDVAVPHATTGTAPAAIDWSATCPHDRRPANKDERDACQDEVIRAAMVQE